LDAGVYERMLPLLRSFVSGTNIFEGLSIMLEKH